MEISHYTGVIARGYPDAQGLMKSLAMSVEKIRIEVFFDAQKPI